MLYDTRRLIRQLNSDIGVRSGVKTDEGKLASRKNALKHGVLANALENGYDKMDVASLFKALGEEFNVTTLHESILLEQLVMCYLKLARCSRIESEIMHECEHTQVTVEDLLNDTGVQDEDKASISDLTLKRLEMILTRYEPQLINRMLKLIEVLKKYQQDKSI